MCYIELLVNLIGSNRLRNLEVSSRSKDHFAYVARYGTYFNVTIISIVTLVRTVVAT